MAKVTVRVKAGHPTMRYHRDGIQFAKEPLELDDADISSSILSDPWLIVDGLSDTKRNNIIRAAEKAEEDRISNAAEVLANASVLESLDGVNVELKDVNEKLISLAQNYGSKIDSLTQRISELETNINYLTDIAHVHEDEIDEVKEGDTAVETSDA